MATWDSGLDLPPETQQVRSYLLKQIAAELKHSDLAGLTEWLGLESADQPIRGLVLHVAKNNRVDVYVHPIQVLRQNTPLDPANTDPNLLHQRYFRNLKDPEDDALSCSWKLPKSRVILLLTEDPKEPVRSDHQFFTQTSSKH